MIFGVTGDLSRKKLMPAVYDLANRGLLPPGFGLVGFARRDWTDEDFEQVVLEAVQAVRPYARSTKRSGLSCATASASSSASSMTIRRSTG